MGRTQASGLRHRVGRVGGRRASASARGERHDQVAAGDERLLVGGRDDLAGPQRGEHRPEADDAARGDDDEVDVVPRRESLERVRVRGRRAVPAGSSSRAAASASASATTRGRTAPAGREGLGVATGGQRRRPGRRPGRAAQDVERLAADRPGRAEQRDADRRRRRDSGAPAPGAAPSGRDDTRYPNTTGRREQERVDAVEDAAVARDERARVLGAGRPLEHRLGDVAGLRR